MIRSRRFWKEWTAQSAQQWRFDFYLKNLRNRSVVPKDLMTTAISISKKTFKNKHVCSNHSLTSTAATPTDCPTLTLHAISRSFPLVHASCLVRRFHLRRLQQVRGAQSLLVHHALFAVRSRKREWRQFHAKRMIPAIPPREQPPRLFN